MPIHLAVQGCLDNVQLLMDHGADINARVKLDGQSHFGPIHATPPHVKNHFQAERSGEKDAVYFRNIEMVTYLLLNGAFVNDKNLDGMTPLHVAAKMGLLFHLQWELLPPSSCG